MNFQTVISRKTPKTRRPVEKRLFFISSSLKKKPIELKKNKKFTIGRSSKNSLRVNEGTVSDRHASIKWEKSSFKITDNRSTNGTFVNGRRISGVAVLKPGDKIRLGKFVLTFTSKKVREKQAPSPKKKTAKKTGTARTAKKARSRKSAGRKTARRKAARKKIAHRILRRDRAVTRIRF
ncbi:MAG: FHA domain-containing protein [Spirochaetales bacterium]|nr:FHA domain-containing protein [Spirochaetales bacterium]